MRTNKLIIISGGQSGVDRAALDFAIKHGIPCGGWCPADRISEEGIIPDHYPLKETVSKEYSERTKLNIEDSDGTLIIFLNIMDEGTQFTLRYAREKNNPLYIINGKRNLDVDDFKKWIRDKGILTLNIAGSRESSEPGIYEFTISILTKVFPGMY